MISGTAGFNRRLRNWRIDDYRCELDRGQNQLPRCAIVRQGGQVGSASSPSICDLTLLAPGRRLSETIRRLDVIRPASVNLTSRPPGRENL